MQAYCIKYAESEGREAIVVSPTVDAMVSYLRSQHRHGVRLQPILEVPVIEIPEGSFVATVLRANGSWCVSDQSSEVSSFADLTHLPIIRSEAVRPLSWLRRMPQGYAGSTLIKPPSKNSPEL